MEHLQTHDLLSNLENPSGARGGGTCPLCERNFTPEDKEHFRFLNKGTPDELRVCNMCYYRDPAVQQKEAEKRAEKKARKQAEAAAVKKAREEAEMCELKL